MISLIVLILTVNVNMFEMLSELMVMPQLYLISIRHQFIRMLAVFMFWYLWDWGQYDTAIKLPKNDHFYCE